MSVNEPAVLAISRYKVNRLDMFSHNEAHIKSSTPYWLYPDLFCFDSLHLSQQFFSHVGLGFPGLNQY